MSLLILPLFAISMIFPGRMVGQQAYYPDSIKNEIRKLFEEVKKIDNEVSYLEYYTIYTNNDSQSITEIDCMLSDDI